MKYLDDDLESVANGTKSITEVAWQYNVSVIALKRAMNRRGYYLRKKKIKITTPYKTYVVDGIQECANTLKLSTQSIKNALKGKRVKTLEELNIKIELL